METRTPANFWWLKPTPIDTLDNENNLIVPRLDLHTSSSIVDLLEKDKNSNLGSDVDVGSILEEINRVAAQSPLGPYEQNIEERSIDDIMKEAERIYMESSKSFEQLSQRSKTSQNLTDLLSNLSKSSTPTPKSISPLPMDPDPQYSSESDDNDYTQDFSEESKIESNPSPIDRRYDKLFSSDNNKNSPVNSQAIEGGVSLVEDKPTKNNEFIGSISRSISLSRSKLSDTLKDPISHQGRLDNTNIDTQNLAQVVNIVKSNKNASENAKSDIDNEKVQRLDEVIGLKNDLIKTLEHDNKNLKCDIKEIKLELQNANILLERTKIALNAKTVSSPEISLELGKALEDLKDSKENNTALQLQLDTVNKSHQFLKSSYDDLVTSNKNLERRVVELDSTLDKYKNELLNLQRTKDKLVENESNLNKLLEIEKLQGKSLKLQNEKDSKCIQDLNRQIKEMERIIARKHPDSVSALIVAAKENATDTNLTARRVLEDRIKSLEQEQLSRDSQSSKIFLEIQDKFNQMKAKYENHIEDLELHVNDLKMQLKRTADTYDVYTQTIIIDEKIPQKDTFTVSTQTDAAPSKPQRIAPVRKTERAIVESAKKDAHLLATIRGLQADLANKEKVVTKLQKEIDDLRKTNRRLQKEREGSLRNLSEKREFRSYPEKLALQTRSNSISSEKDFRKDEELQQVKGERDRLKQQLSRLEQDYQALKTKRIQDLTALQEAHEQEVTNYVASVTPLREQLEVQQVSIAALQSQLNTAKGDLAIVTVERDHLNNRLLSVPCSAVDSRRDDGMEIEALLKKIAFLEKRYEEREYRLRAIVHSLAQKNVTNRSCEQCAERQQQLIGYKVELDQLLATVRALH